jgi:hypothetical protein
MANTENTCSQLVINYETAKEFDEILDMQKSLQLRIDPNFDNPNESIASVARFLLGNKHALEDELSETMDALGGIHDGFGPAAWKWWKKDNKGIMENMTIKELTERDTIELKMEIVDQFHFFMNQMIKVGMTGSELYSMYKSKNAENFNRQNNGY